MIFPPDGEMPGFDLPSRFAELVVAAFMLYSLVIEEDDLLLVSNGALLIIIVSRWVRELRRRFRYFYTPEHVDKNCDWS